MKALAAFVLVWMAAAGLAPRTIQAEAGDPSQARILLVPDFMAEGSVPAEEAALFSELVRTRIIEGGLIQVREAGAERSFMIERELAGLTGLFEAEGVQATAGESRPDYVLLGSVAGAGESRQLKTRLIETSSGSLRFVQSVMIGADGFERTVNGIADELSYTLLRNQYGVNLANIGRLARDRRAAEAWDLLLLLPENARNGAEYPAVEAQTLSAMAERQSRILDRELDAGRPERAAAGLPLLFALAPDNATHEDAARRIFEKQDRLAGDRRSRLRETTELLIGQGRSQEALAGLERAGASISVAEDLLLCAQLRAQAREARRRELAAQAAYHRDAASYERAAFSAAGSLEIDPARLESLALLNGINDDILRKRFERGHTERKSSLFTPRVGGFDLLSTGFSLASLDDTLIRLYLSPRGEPAVFPQISLRWRSSRPFLPPVQLAWGAEASWLFLGGGASGPVQPAGGLLKARGLFGAVLAWERLALMAGATGGLGFLSNRVQGVPSVAEGLYGFQASGGLAISASWRVVGGFMAEIRMDFERFLWLPAYGTGAFSIGIDLGWIVRE